MPRPGEGWYPDAGDVVGARSRRSGPYSEQDPTDTLLDRYGTGQEMGAMGIPVAAIYEGTKPILSFLSGFEPVRRGARALGLEDQLPDASTAPASLENVNAVMRGAFGLPVDYRRRQKPAAAGPAPDTSSVTYDTTFRLPEIAAPALPPIPVTPAAGPAPSPAGGGLPQSPADLPDLGRDVGLSFPVPELVPIDDDFGSVPVTQSEMDFAEQNQARVNAGLPPLDPRTGLPVGEKPQQPQQPGPADALLDQQKGSDLTPEERAVGQTTREQLQDEYGYGMGDMLYRMGFGGGGAGVGSDSYLNAF